MPEGQRSPTAAAWAAGLLLAAWAVVLLLLPTRNADLSWHLFFGRWIAAHRAVPHSEFLSSTRFGSPWIDFEWLYELLLAGVSAAAGCAGRRALRAALVAGAVWVTDRTVAREGVSPAWRALSACALLLTILPMSDVRPDNVSLLFFAAALLLLERLSAGTADRPVRAAAIFGALFALWANFHLGVCFGLVLVACYAAGSALSLEDGRLRLRAPKRALLAALAAAAAGTLVNPYGWRLYAAAWDHARAMRVLEVVDMEWMAPDVRSLGLWPFFLLCAAVFGAELAALVRRKRLPPARLLSCAFFALAASRHVRHVPYFALAGFPALAGTLSQEGLRPARRARELAAAAAAAALALSFGLFVVPLAAAGPGGRRCAAYGAGAARFLEREAPELSGKTLYHDADYGGAWELALAPRYRVFWDGRYLFQDLLVEKLLAMRSPRLWQGFLLSHGVELACMPRRGGGRVVPAGRGGPSRPYYAAFMPESRWALVYWDGQDLLFARRDAVDRRWLSAHEFRAYRPDDEAQLALRLKKGEVSAREVARERARAGG